MRRYLPFAIIGTIFLIAIGSGLMLFRWKQPPSAPIAPIVPIAPTVPTVPVAPEAPGKPDAQSPHIRGGADARQLVGCLAELGCAQHR